MAGRQLKGHERAHMASKVKDDRVAQRADELFDVVDEHDRVIGQACRADVHARKLWHRAIHVLVFDRTGRVFLQRRSLEKDIAPGRWDSSCSGHLDAGEDYDTAAVRELGEELGLELTTAPTRWLRMDACAQTGWEFVWVYRLEHEGPFRLHPAEIMDGAWYVPAELEKALRDRPNDFAGAFRTIWKKLA
jgi:isopentenyl-diphosphate delta-isomerase type 1